MPVTVRQARPSDCDGLLAMIRDHAKFERSEATISKEDLSRILGARPPRVNIFVAAQQHCLLGYACVTTDYSLWRGQTWAHLDCLYVETQTRSQGVGASLFHHAKATAHRLGADRLEWQTPEWNERAIAFYIREGASGQVKMRFAVDT
ncbi:MAG: GNAT family N-acetyltransferase [Phenylobacterium zucineum]|nr:MAG: GNAT family N-acetyltransferase [Phenylobacterium zucineum]